METTHLTPSHRPVLGIDIGRVIIGPVDDAGHADTTFLSGSPAQALATQPSPGAFDSIAQLTRAFAGAVWLVSKAGPRVQDKTRSWLDHWRFWSATGVPRGRLRFCLERPQKADHCRELRITHFIDDRLDVLDHLHGLVPHLYLFGPQPRSTRPPPWAVPVVTWADALSAILSTLEGCEGSGCTSAARDRSARPDSG